MRDLFIFLGIVLVLGACTQGGEKDITSPTPFLKVDYPDLDSMLASMSIEEKIGQLIMARTDLSSDTLNQDLYQAVYTRKLGGLLIEKSSLDQFLSFQDTASKLANLPLLIGTQEDVLLNNQFSDLLAQPDIWSVQATGNDTLIEKVRTLYARQANQLGVNFSLSAHFTENQAGDSNAAFVSNLNHHKILAGVKEVPANHLLNQRDTACQLDAMLAPFEKWHQEGMSMLYLKQIAPYDSIGPSYSLLEHYLRKDVGFEGLVLADWTASTPVQQLLQAGTDVFIVDDHFCNQVFAALLMEFGSSNLNLQVLDDKVGRILMAKKWAKTRDNHTVSPVKEQPLVLQASFKPTQPTMPARFLDHGALNDHFKDEKWDLLRYKIYEKSMVLVNNKDAIIPFQSLQERRFRVINFGPSGLRTFKEYFSKYADSKYYHFGPDTEDVLSLLRPSKSEGYTTVITFDEVLLKEERDTTFIQALNDLAAKTDLVLVNFGEPENFQPFDTSLSLIQISERNDITESLAAQLLFGGVASSGQLPATINAHFPEGHGVATEALRLKYGIPEEVGIAPEKLVGIDAIIKTAIDDGAMPGCQVLVAKDGNVVYSKSFGHHTFLKKQAVKTTDLYDLASITKVAATTLATMKLYDEGKVKLDNRLHELLDWKGRSTIRYISMKKLLTHHSGLQPNMPIAPYIMYRDVANAGCDSFFCKNYSNTYSVKVADNFYFDQGQVDKIWEKIHSLPVGSQRRYRYSDVNFVLLQKVAETVSEKSLNEQLDENFYGPLGLRYNMFNPTKRFDPEQIVPTQNDYRWRHQLVRGYVHDESAALLGGVAGNAGLFSNAEDLAIPFQMLLNKGHYAGQQFLKPETIDLFTKTHTSSRRGLGFYKPFQGSDYTPGPSAQTFGHTGFTGTAVWADPDQNLLYIFLSNRIHPSVRNSAFSRSRVRKRVQQVVYDALDTYEFEMPELPTTPEEGGIKG